MEKFYIYKITLTSGATYIGSHIQRKENDGYSNSSKYIKRHPEDKILKREILFYLPTLEQMNVMETICIMEDKCYSKNNINGNYGNWLYNFHSKLDCPWNKGLKMPESFGAKISEIRKEPIVCLETNEIFYATSDIMHSASVISGKRKSANGLHYRKLEKDEDISAIKDRNKQELLNIYKGKIFYLYGKKVFSSLGQAATYLKVDPKTALKKIEKIGYNYIIEHNLNLEIRKQKPKEKRKVICLETGKIFSSIKEAEAYYNCSHISLVINGKRKVAGGYYWELVDKN